MSQNVLYQKSKCLQEKQTQAEETKLERAQIEKLKAAVASNEAKEHLLLSLRYILKSYYVRSHDKGLLAHIVAYLKERQQSLVEPFLSKLKENGIVTRIEKSYIQNVSLLACMDLLEEWEEEVAEETRAKNMLLEEMQDKLRQKHEKSN